MSSRWSMVVVALSGLALLASPRFATAQEPTPLAHLFPRRAAIDTPAGALVRLPLPAEVIVASRPDLSDVRVFDASDEEVPYLIDRGTRPLPSADPEPVTRVLPIGASRERTRASGIVRHRETFELQPPGSPPPGAEWVLRIDTASPRFVHTVRVVAVDPRGPERELTSGSFYRLGAPLRERLELALPGVRAAPVRVVIEGEDGFLEPTFTFFARRAARTPSTVSIPLTIASQRRAGGRTVLTIERPAGIAPERIAIATSTASFVRPVEVRSISAVSGPRTLGHGTVLRVELVPGAEELEVDVAPASGARIEIEIDDGDSPPLESIAITAIVRQPSLIFEGRSATRLRFGGGRVREPRYDLQALFGSAIGEELLDRRLGVDAVLGPIEDDPDFDPRPALAFAMRAGAPIEVERFASVAPMTVPAAREGLSRTTLGADVLAAARQDLGDLRVVGEDGRQWPYVFSEEPVIVEAALRIEGPLEAGESELEEGWSRYRLIAPVARLAPSAIVLEVASELVDREVRVLGRDENDTELPLGGTHLLRRPGDSAQLVIALQGIRTESLELQVHDGDEAPLVLSSALARLPSRELYVTATPGDYRLFAGDPSALAPDYEISRARGLILAVDASPAVVGPVTANPRYRAPSPLEAAGIETVVMWAVLIGAVLVLGLLTLRVARTAPEPAPEPGGSATSEPGGDEPPPTASKPSDGDPSASSPPPPG